jgi:chromosome segregation ATPase
MPTLEEQLEELRRELSTLQADRISDVRQLNKRIDALQRQINEQKDRVAEQERNLFAGFDDLAKYQIQFEQKIDARFDKIEATMATKDDIVNMATKDDIAAIHAIMATKDDIANMATKDDIVNMATKDDIASIRTDMASLELRMQGNLHAMEGRMLDAFKQVLVMIDSRLPPPTT